MANNSKTLAIAPVESNATVEQGMVDVVTVEDKGFVPTSTQDKALEFFGGRPRDFAYTPQEAVRVRWKLDLILLPMVSTSAAVIIRISTANTSLADVHDLRPQFYGQSSLVRGICIWHTGRPRNYAFPPGHISKLTVL